MADAWHPLRLQEGNPVGFSDAELAGLYAQLSADVAQAPARGAGRTAVGGQPPDGGVGPAQFAAFVMRAFAARFIDYSDE